MAISRIQSKSSGNETTVRVEGDLNGEMVRELERCWRKARSAGSCIQLDLCSVHEIDDAGKTLLTYMFGSGVELVVGPRKHIPTRRPTLLGKVTTTWRIAEN